MSTFIASEAPWLKGLPAGWEPKSLRFILQNNDGGAWGGDPNGEDDVVVLRSTEQTSGGYWNIEEPAYRSLSTSEHQATCLLKGDLLVTKSSGSAIHIGKTTLVDDDVAALRAGYSNFMQRLRVEDGVEPKFVWYLLNSDQAKLQINLESTTTTGLANLNGGLLGRLIFAFPERSAQIAIAAYLDAETKRIDELISAKKNLKEKLSGLSQSIFIDELVAISNKLPGAVTERLPWMPTVPSSWTRCKVKHLVNHFDQGVSPQCESRKPDEGEWGVMKAGCINSGNFDPTESKALPPEITPIPEVTVCEGDLIISRANTRDLVGRSAVSQHDYPRLMLSDKLYRLKLDKARCVPEFLRRTLWVSAVRSRIEERASGASPSMQNIDRRTILELDIVLPTIDEQVQILVEVDARTQAIQLLIEHVNTEIELLAEMRSATITDAVLGRIDVRKSQTH